MSGLQPRNRKRNYISLTSEECRTPKDYAVNGIIAKVENSRLQERIISANKSASIWKQRYEAVNEKYTELKKKAQPY